VGYPGPEEMSIQHGNGSGKPAESMILHKKVGLSLNVKIAKSFSSVAENVLSVARFWQNEKRNIMKRKKE
jgi:hypothetical protein